jgi:hypothetical protein
LLTALAFTGCTHRMPVDKRVFSLEGPAEYPIMTPSGSPGKTESDFQDYPFELGGDGALNDAAGAAHCTVKGSVFSLAPAQSPDRKAWVITSLTVRGWERRSDSTDVESEWIGFAHEVLALRRAGCFPGDESPQEIMRKIAEAIPLPASEELLYSYSFGRPGIVDLVPGMQLVIERAFFETGAGKRVPASGVDEFRERLAVVRRHPSGSALRLVDIVSRGLGKTFERAADSPRSVPERFAASSLLRLQLLTLSNDQRRRLPVLLGATQTHQLWEASDRIVEGTLGTCPASTSPSLACMFFDKDSAVSVLMSVWVNGRHVYHPLTTTLGSLLGRLPESEMGRALATVHIDRALTGGGYARVNFPHDQESAGKIILLNGDRLTWQR